MSEERLEKIEKILRLIQQKLKDNDDQSSKNETIVAEVVKKVQNVEKSNKTNEDMMFTIQKQVRQLNKDELLQLSPRQKRSPDIITDDAIRITIKKVKEHDDLLQSFVETLNKTNSTAIPVLRQTIVSLNGKVIEIKKDIEELKKDISTLKSSHAQKVEEKNLERQNENTGGTTQDLSVEIERKDETKIEFEKQRGELNDVKKELKDLKDTITLIKSEQDNRNSTTSGSPTKLEEITVAPKSRSFSVDSHSTEAFNMKLSQEMEKKDVEIVTLRTAQANLSNEIEQLKSMRQEIDQIKNENKNVPKLDTRSGRMRLSLGKNIQLSPPRQDLSIDVPDSPESAAEPPDEKESEKIISDLNMYENIGGFYKHLSEWSGLTRPKVVFFSNIMDRADISDFNNGIIGKKNVMVIVGTKKNEVFGAFCSKRIPKPPTSAAKKDSNYTAITGDAKHFIFTLLNSKFEKKRFDLKNGKNQEVFGVYNEKSKDYLFSVPNFFVFKKKECKVIEGFEKSYECQTTVVEGKSFKPAYVVALSWSK
ncbi:hypothetical protein EIN_253370 [Entamoeba invadens IP1]|uniref:Uncharacterized protein n=1 Tax=Entamoeba invadens IP1 TaxID=370355 RepID=A0A0A1UF16_ENTIV|nr:hypothetical protein EIN_253370 [Entamoeba invadens IP1]ELP95073.1 hypothetical protein EIN_253370 [Entamoeba invadens IP1]|eukprot:XP_004261844.1 hypothetical protein EIN_253370 [Entamoeba invadens IP1]